MSNENFANFSPYTDSYQDSRPTASVPYAPLQNSQAGSSGGATGSVGSSEPSANPFSQPYRSPANDPASSEAGGNRVNCFETSLPLRVDLEAALSYSMLAFSGVIMLILEQKNDYVRFHAWQSTILFVSLGLLQFILGWLSHTLAWIIVIFSFLLAAFLGFKAYQNGSSLDRFMLPVIGAYASRWTDTE
ncbi:MAG: hypothetical protein DHS80DRAFT_29223 [Piptocephalis tieghemiana]|nr:MAG: hypothetical protein DHS80DRAFT_29223 [Piptocephalis tieghemiana]